MSYYYPRAAIKLRILPEDFQLTSDASLQTPVEITVIAKDLVVNVNDHKTCDSFNCEIDYKNFPFDPRTIRSCGVIIYMEDVKANETPEGAQNKIVPKRSNVIFSGFVDEDTMTLDENNQTVRFEGRDFSALFIDQKYKEQVPIDIKQPLDKILGLFLSTFKATQQITLWWKESDGKVVPIEKRKEGPMPILGQYYPNFGGSGALGGHRNSGPHESYWDIMQDLVQKAGMIAYIDLDRLILTTPRNLYNPAIDAKFIYGVNIKSMTFKRKLGRFKGFNLVVRSRVDKDVLEARIPEEATPEWCKSFGIEREAQVVPILKPDGTLDKSKEQKAPYISFPVTNIANKDQLVRIGQSVYEEYSRQQLEGSFETVEMLSHAGIDRNDKNYHVYDLTQIDIGQPLAIEIATDDLDKITRLKSNADREHYLIRRGYDRTVAGVFAKTMGKFSPRFYTKAYTLTLNSESGFKMHVDIINIIDLTQRGIL